MRSEFQYHRPDSVQKAILMKAELGKDACFWAGGTDLMLQWKHEKIHPQHCIDLTSIADLQYTKFDSELLSIGALTTLSEIERIDRNDPYMRTLADVAKLMATQQTRTLATIAGNLCNASPAADLLVTLTAMAAYLKVTGSSGQRELKVEDLLSDPGTTCLQQDEVVTEVCIPIGANRRASSYRRIDRTVVDIALVSAAAAMTVDSNDSIESITISLGAVAPRVIRSAQAEKMLIGNSLTALDYEFSQTVGEAAAADATPISDIRASAEYRKAMVKVLVSRVLDDISLVLSGESND